jgi:molybdenum-dependent DNA-binding transcriptional regulator ModE
MYVLIRYLNRVPGSQFQVLSTLDYMGKRLDIVSTSSTDVDEFHQAIAHVSEAASKRMPDVHAQRPTPVKRRTSSVPLSAFTPMMKLKPTASLALPTALQDALRHAGISFHALDTLEGLQDMLIQAQAEREKKGRDHFQATATTTHEQVAERSSRADRDLKIIMDALYAYTPFQQVSLTNSKLEAHLKAMDRELDHKDRELLDAEGSELSLSDPKVRAFIAKYGRQGR